MRFATRRLPVSGDAVAPDGSDVRVLLALRGGSLAHFELAPGQTSIAVAHHTVEEIWFFLRGRGELWRKLGGHEEVVAVEPGVCVTIPLGTQGGTAPELRWPHGVAVDARGQVYVADFKRDRLHVLPPPPGRER